MDITITQGTDGKPVVQVNGNTQIPCIGYPCHETPKMVAEAYKDAKAVLEKEDKE